MNYRPFLFAIIFVVFVFSFPLVVARGADTCSANGYTIFTINGVRTDEDGARLNRNAFEDKFLLINTDQFNFEPIFIDYLHNPSHLGGLGDWLKAAEQGIFDSENLKDYDLTEILLAASEKLKTQKFLLVGHSQGNFYANSFYGAVVDKDGGISKESIAVYGVASPSSFVAGNGKYITSETDKVIDWVSRHHFRKVLLPNTRIELKEGDDPSGHNFSDIYLKYQADKIISDIKSSLDRLKTNKIQDVQKSCLAPPELSIAHQRQGEVFSFIDPIANGVISVPIAIIQTAVSIVKAGVEKVVEVAQVIKETFSNVFKKDQFYLAQVVDLSQETQPDQSGQTQSQPASPNQCSFDTQKSASHSKIIINEVSWMDGISSANDEWIELKNISGGSLDISGYQLLDQAEQIKIIFNKNTIIPAGGFFLLERNSDEAVSSVKADLIYKGVLSNTDEGLRLLDVNCDLIDEVLANPKWPAGDNTAKKTMERDLTGFNWHTSSVVGGTPRKENSQIIIKKLQTIPEEDEEEENEDQNLNQPISTSTIIQEQIPLNQNTFQVCSFNTNQSARRQGVIINEVAWMGTTNSANDEWIELKNISGDTVNLSNWQLLDKDEQIKIKFDNTLQIPSGGFILLERTDDDTVSEIKADKIYTGGLSNNDEGLRLFDGQCNLIDEVSANLNWPAGVNTVKRTMERKSDFNWQDSVNVGGTPKAENSLGYIDMGGSNGSTSNNNQQQTNNNSSSTPAKILITEVQITGGSGKTENDFIELYNPNSSPVNINGYRLVKRTKTATSDSGIKSWTTDAFIPANGYYLWANSGYTDISVSADVTTSGIVSNDNGVAIRFGAEDTGTIIDSVGWGETQNSFVEGQVFGANPGANQSIQRKFQNNTFIDTDNNAQDFEIQTCPSPKTQTGNCSSANQAPSAFFVYVPSNPAVGDLVAFDAASSTDSDGQIIFYQWDFGDNTTSSPTTATTTHSYLDSGTYSVNLTVFDDQKVSSTAASLVISIISTGVNHILISEVYPDQTGNNFDFVELYNPTDSSIKLGDYSLKILKGGTTTTSPLASFSAEQIIAAKSFFLIGLDKYDQSTSTVADVFRSSYSLLTTEPATIILYNKSDYIDEFNYNPVTLAPGQSFERKVFSGEVCVSAQNDGEFLGNDCDINNANDFEIRQTPNPQNSQNFPEPRNAPNPPSNFSVQYSSSTMKLFFNWDASQDYSGDTSAIAYKITDISDTSPTLATINTTSTTAEISINEVGRDYKFSIQAFDKEGLGSAIATTIISVPSFLSSLYFYQDPRDNSKNLIEAYYEQYPFIPDLFDQNKWQTVVFYLNDNLLEQPNELTNVLTIKYKQCAGGTQAGSLLIPLSSYYCGTSGGAFNQALDFSELEDNHFIIQTAGSNQELNLTNQNYLAVVFYTTHNAQTYDGRAPSFQLVAVDKTKYYFQDNLPIHHAPDFTGEIALNFDQQNSRLNISWPKASDKDTLDSLLSYEIKYNDSEEWQSLSSIASAFRSVALGNNLAISVRAKDDFNNYSASILTANWSYPETTFRIKQDIVSSWSDGFGQMDWNGNYGVSLQSIMPENDFQFDTIVLRIKHTGGDDYGTTLKLSVFSNNATNNQPNFNNLIVSTSLVGFLNNSEDQDLAFYFANSVLINAGIKYWLALEVESYSYGGYYVLIGNSWVNAIAENNPYNLGEAGKTTIRNSSYNENVSINSAADWYMRIGMTKDE